jgi:predicted nucleotidyltransferase
MVNITLQQRIQRLLSVKVGKRLNQNQIALALKVSQPAVMKALKGLEGIIIQQDKETKRWSISLDINDHKMIQFKRTDNLRQIYESGLADFLDMKFAGACIILFGSYSKGEDSIGSDIDIAVVGRKEKSADFSEYERILERKIHISFYPSMKAVHKHLRENLCNGIVFSGGIEL